MYGQLQKDIETGLVLQTNTEKSADPNDLPAAPKVMCAQAPVPGNGTQTLLTLATHHCA